MSCKARSWYWGAWSSVMALIIITLFPRKDRWKAHGEMCCPHPGNSWEVIHEGQTWVSSSVVPETNLRDIQSWQLCPDFRIKVLIKSKYLDAGAYFHQQLDGGTNLVCLSDQTGVKLSQFWSKSSFWTTIQRGKSGGIWWLIPSVPHLHGKCSGNTGGRMEQAEGTYSFGRLNKLMEMLLLPQPPAQTSTFSASSNKKLQGRGTKSPCITSTKNAAEIKIVASNKTNNVQ